MNRFQAGLNIQIRVISALMIRELSTRFGRENIGFLWVMVEPLMFALLVSVIWRAWRGPEEYGIDIVAFVVTGYIPLTFFRHAIARSVGSLKVNASLMYHRQIKILDLVLTRFLIEMLGSMMGYVFIGVTLYELGFMPWPSDIGLFIAGWLVYSFFTFSICIVVCPLSEKSEIVEKFVPVTTYVIVPFSGTFSLTQWLAPRARDLLYYSPPVSGMELMRAGLFGDLVHPYYNFVVPLTFSLIMTMIGLSLCRRVRRTLVVE